MKLCQPSMLPLLERFQEMEFTHQPPTEFKTFLLALCTAYPIACLVHYDNELYKLLEDVSVSLKFERDLMNVKRLREGFPVLATLIDVLGEVPEEIGPIIKEVVVRSQAAYRRADQCLVEQSLPPVIEDGGSAGYFPCLRKKCERGTYKLDKKQSEENVRRDHKTQRGKSTLGPGLFLLSCIHGM